MTGQYEMLLEQNADVPVRDGAILHANVYRPNASGRIPRCGSRMAMSLSMWTPVVPVSLRVGSIQILLRSFVTSMMRLSGRAPSRGAAARSGCLGFPITLQGNGLSPRCGHRISRQFYLGRAPTTFIATAHVRTGSTQADFSNVGGTAAFCATNTAIRIPTVGTSTPANV